jgi:hypothetical protein
MKGWLGTQVGFRGRLHRLYIYPAGRLERLAFFSCKGFLVRQHQAVTEECMTFARENMLEVRGVTPAWHTGNVDARAERWCRIHVQAPSTRRKVVIIRRGELAQLWGRIPREVLPVHLGACQAFLCALARSRTLRQGTWVAMFGEDRHANPQSSESDASAVVRATGGANAHIRLGDDVRSAHWSTLCGKSSSRSLLEGDAATPRAAPEGAPGTCTEHRGVRYVLVADTLSVSPFTHTHVKYVVLKPSSSPSWAGWYRPGSQAEDTATERLAEERPVVAAAAEVMGEHEGALVPARVQEEEEQEKVWPWVPRDLDDAFWGACRNAISTLVLLVRQP